MSKKYEKYHGSYHEPYYSQRGRYELRQKLGTGGVGTTYLGIDKDKLGAECAVKKLTPQSQEPKVLERVRQLFQREAETLNKLGHHDQIPELWAYFEENQEFYLVQEFIRGKTLTQELASGGHDILKMTLWNF